MEGGNTRESVFTLVLHPRAHGSGVGDRHAGWIRGERRGGASNIIIYRADGG